METGLKIIFILINLIIIVVGIIKYDERINNYWKLYIGDGYFIYSIIAVLFAGITFI